jgi:hypothetical protein
MQEAARGLAGRNRGFILRPWIGNIDRMDLELLHF